MKLLFAAETVTKIHQWSKCKDQAMIGCVTPSGMHFQQNSSAKGSENSVEEGVEYFMSQRTKKFVVRLCLTVTQMTGKFHP